MIHKYFAVGSCTNLVCSGVVPLIYDLETRSNHGSHRKGRTVSNIYRNLKHTFFLVFFKIKKDILLRKQCRHKFVTTKMDLFDLPQKSITQCFLYRKHLREQFSFNIKFLTAGAFHVQTGMASSYVLEALFSHALRRLFLDE